MADHARTLSPDSPPVVVGSAGDVQAFQDRAATRPSDLRIVGRIAADEHEAPGPAFTDRVPLVGRVGRLRDAAAQVEIRRGTSGAFIHLHPRRLDLPQLAIKRTMDVILAAGALVAVAPLLAAVALAIKFDSRGPVLFRQTRMGVGGRRFQILKFRTMVADADRQKASLAHLNGYPDARLFKIKHDPRITRLGHFLRRTSFDELPQLWNVLRGEMSLVGPRPCVPEEFEHCARHHMERLFVVPGVTGPGR